MIHIKPFPKKYDVSCPYCHSQLRTTDIVWQGIHVLACSRCDKCNKTILSDLPTGHGLDFPFQIDVADQRIFGPQRGLDWLGKPLLQSLLHPSNERIRFTAHVRGKKKHKTAIIVNCIDNIYGHCLLKLFNVQRYKHMAQKTAIIVLVPECIRWLVPTYVHETWSIQAPIGDMEKYFPSIEAATKKRLNAYKNVYLSKASCHPKHVRIEDFSKIRPNIKNDGRMIAFYYRQDRLLTGNGIFSDPMLSPLLQKFLLLIEKYKILYLFTLLRRKLPEYSFAIVGIGKQMHFPRWIHDYRIASYDQRNEKRMCSVYAKSALVIGTLGSHMILPAAHAFMSLELYTSSRTDSFCLDLVIPTHEAAIDPRLYYFRHRILPSQTDIRVLANAIVSMMNDHQYSQLYWRNK